MRMNPMLRISDFLLGSPMDPRRSHHARIRRSHIIDDAYDQFNSLGDGLKDPIQITFVDAFDQDEAGIDGGGVTKEFLTSITKEMFTPSNKLQLFVENEQHLQYPNPAAMDEFKEILVRQHIPEGTEEHRRRVSQFLSRYEFLGRIIGKCLYEGILVDVAFAGFFLLKWALTGGNGSAPRESGYRANINDLRELDEALYQGLVSQPTPLRKSR
jgi:ubiquitin-protein ligase E3 C